jgi:hypothetical protein
VELAPFFLSLAACDLSCGLIISWGWYFFKVLLLGPGDSRASSGNLPGFRGHILGRVLHPPATSSFQGRAGLALKTRKLCYSSTITILKEFYMRSKRQFEKSERMRELNILSGHVSAVMLMNEEKSKDCEDILTIIDMAREELKLELFPVNDELFGQFKNELLHMIQQKGLEV